MSRCLDIRSNKEDEMESSKQAGHIGEGAMVTEKGIPGKKDTKMEEILQGKDQHVEVGQITFLCERICFQVPTSCMPQTVL